MCWHCAWIVMMCVNGVNMQYYGVLMVLLFTDPSRINISSLSVVLKCWLVCNENT
jgi:hypothetical protein